MNFALSLIFEHLFIILSTFVNRLLVLIKSFIDTVTLKCSWTSFVKKQILTLLN